MSRELKGIFDDIQRNTGLSQDKFLTDLRNRYAPVQQHPFFDELEREETPLDVWQRWAIRRYQASCDFMPFLISARDKAKKAKFTRVVEILNHNIREEVGRDPRTISNMT